MKNSKAAPYDAPVLMQYDITLSRITCSSLTKMAEIEDFDEEEFEW